jgi:serine/threonine protein kinase/tetratricopeptide (TPR) repeat protein
MGEVWLTRDRELDVRIAIKLLHPHLAAAEGAVVFMKNECRAARRLTHPNIVRVYDFHQQDALAFISMEWIDGPTFDAWTPAPSTDRHQPIRILLAVADAIEDIHRQGLVHRDVKARNILMTPSGQPKLTDFGIVGLWRFQPGLLNIQSGGSHASMSPQQREGLPPQPADDIYAFGLLLQACLTVGDATTAPGEMVDANATLAPNVRTIDAPPCIKAPGLRELATQMQATAPEDRPASMADVKTALRAALVMADPDTSPPDIAKQPIDLTSADLAGEPIASQPYTPVAESATETVRQRPVFWALALTMGALGLIAIGIWGIGILAQPPQMGQPPAKPAKPTVSAPPPTVIRSDKADLPQVPKPPASPQPAVDLQSAEKILAQWLLVKDQLQTAHAVEWAPEKVEIIKTAAQQADAAMTAKTYDEAARYYAAATADGEALLASRDELFAAAIRQGQDRLRADQPGKARAFFNRALYIKPDDTVARQGLAAADQREKALDLMASGQSHEREERYDLALADYEEALQIDKAYDPARQAVERLKNQVAETHYKRLVSDGLNAFYQNRLGAARRHIQAALQYRPGGHEAREALRQIEMAAREQQIARLRQQGQAAENGERWDRALKVYENALALDPALQFAATGAARSRERIRIDKRLRYYLDHPETLSSERYLQEARDLLHTAEALSPRGPQLAAQIQTLVTRVQNAQTRIPVTVMSDGETEVAVLRVARLGRITSQTLELRPGLYTIVGARDGYKDVRQTIRLEADQPAVQVRIACTEKI